MRKTSIVVALCFVLIGTLTAISDATAASTEDSSFQRFDISIGEYTYGEVIVDKETNQVFAIANVGMASVDERVTLVAQKDGASPHNIPIAQSIVNNDGQVHWRSTLTAEQLDWIHLYGYGAILFARGNI